MRTAARALIDLMFSQFTHVRRQRYKKTPARAAIKAINYLWSQYMQAWLKLMNLLNTIFLFAKFVSALRTRFTMVFIV